MNDYERTLLLGHPICINNQFFKCFVLASLAHFGSCWFDLF